MASQLAQLVKGWWFSLFNLGIEPQQDRLPQLKANFINLFHLLFIAGTLFMVCWRLLTGNYFAALVNVMLMMPLLISLLVCKFNHHQVALNLLMHIVLFLDIFAYSQGSSTQLLLFCAVMPTLSAILSSRRRVPYYYFLIAITLFLVLRVDENQGANTSFVVMMMICFITSSRFMAFLEKTYYDLAKSLDDKDRINQELILFNEILTHDLKTPLRSINGFAQLLDSEIDQHHEKTHSYINQISRSAVSMQNIITDLFNYSKLDQMGKKFSAVDLNEIITDQVQAFQENLVGMDFEVEYGDLPTIRGENNSLRALFNNLFSNALKYQPKTNPTHIPKIKIACHCSDESLIILFSDNGIGVEEGYADQLFTPFKRLHSSTEYDGTGLGLSICRRVMEKHEGTISLEAGNGTGTTMILEFPKALVVAPSLANVSHTEL